MISLFLDTSSFNIVVAIYRDLEELYSITEKNDNHLSERLLPLICDSFNAIQMDIHDIDRIYIINGPGSFTGVRIGVTVAKTIAWALHKEIVPISELEFLATTECENKIIPMIDARRECVYAGVYDSDLNCILKDQYIALEDLKKQFSTNTICISYDEFSFPVEKPKPSISKIIKKHQEDSSIHPHNLNPNYLKITEAEANLHDKNIKAE